MPVTVSVRDGWVVSAPFERMRVSPTLTPSCWASAEPTIVSSAPSDAHCPVTFHQLRMSLTPVVVDSPVEDCTVLWNHVPTVSVSCAVCPVEVVTSRWRWSSGANAVML